MSAGKTFQDKVKFIEKVSEELDSTIGNLAQSLSYSIISEFIDQLERDGDTIKNTPANIRLISQIDAIYQSFIDKNGAKLVNQITGNVNSIFDFNDSYFSEIKGKGFDIPSKKITGIIRDRLGFSGDTRVKLKEGGYMEALLKDTTVRNEIKQISYREVLKGSGFKGFKKAMQNYIAGDEEKLGAFRRHYRQYTYDIYSTIDRDQSLLMANELNLQYFIYGGTLVAKSRDFCIERAGKVFSTEEASQWVKDPWIKKHLENGSITSYNPITDMGLFGCRHTPRFISYEQAIRLRPDLKKDK